ncbi:MAG: STAS domain-containing protein [Cyanobacteria bacterium P01_F01_bin.153]
MSDKVKVVSHSGILDGTQATMFRQRVMDALDGGAKTVLIDFKDVTFMDSSGLGALVLSLKSVRAANCRLVLCSVNEQVKMLLELTSMDRVFEIFESQEAFEKEVAAS